MFAMLAFAADVRVRAVNASESADVLKAGYVYHFANLVEWPASVAPSGRPIVIGVLGNDDFATVLSGVVERKTLDDRTYVVKRLTSGDLKACAGGGVGEDGAAVDGDRAGAAGAAHDRPVGLKRAAVERVRADAGVGSDAHVARKDQRGGAALRCYAEFRRRG